MERLKTRSAALAVAIFLLLSVAGVAAATHITLPSVAAPQALEQVAKDHPASDDDDGEGDEDTPDEDTDEDADADADAADGAQGEHGALVSAVAQNEECVGGAHENHGWAVSQVARGLYVPLAGECPPPVPVVAETELTEVEGSTEELNPAGKPKGKSADHKKAKTHGRWASEP